MERNLDKRRYITCYVFTFLGKWLVGLLFSNKLFLCPLLRPDILLSPREPKDLDMFTIIIWRVGV
jgi:hypothetical protein